MNQIATIWDSVEEHLLGRRGMSFEIAAKKSDWSPEPHHSACWRCAHSVGPFETDGDGCADCRKLRLPWDRAIRVGTFDGILRDAVLDLKFRRWIASGHQLGALMGDRLASELDRNGINASEVRIVPVPITLGRKLRRGVDHTMVLARGIQKQAGGRIEPLLKARKREEQIGLSATARTKNMSGAFYIPREGAKRLQSQLFSEARVIVLIDDVMTTGATLTAASKAVRGAIRGNLTENKVQIWTLCASVAGGTRRHVETDARN